MVIIIPAKHEQEHVNMLMFACSSRCHCISVYLHRAASMAMDSTLQNKTQSDLYAETSSNDSTVKELMSKMSTDSKRGVTLRTVGPRY